MQRRCGPPAHRCWPKRNHYFTVILRRHNIRRWLLAYREGGAAGGKRPNRGLLPELRRFSLSPYVTHFYPRR